MDLFTIIKTPQDFDLYHGTKAQNTMSGGSRLNEFGGVDVNLEDYCREHNINIDDIIIVNPLVSE